ncbi:MAG: hypothetical protein WD556_06150 [Actinomycetota bacterium]
MATAAVTLERITPRPRLRPAALLRRFALSALVVGTLGPLAIANLAAAGDQGATGAGTGFAQEPGIISHARGDLSLADAGPGATAVEEVRVQALGDAGVVGLYAAVEGTGLEDFVQVRVVRDARVVVYEGPLGGLPRTPSTALPDPTGTWTAGETHTYRIVATLQDTNAAQGLTASVDLAWIATPGT